MIVRVADMSFLESYFQLGPIPSDAMQGSYDWHLVLLSYILAVAASYVALDVTERIRASEALRTKMLWLVSGAIAMGCGIWTMHFIGMLAFVMPMPMDYDPWITAFSLLIAVVASGFAFYLIKDQAVKTLPVILGGVIMGIAIVSMHYTGMAAMEGVSIRYLPGLFVASVVIAVITSETALGLMILGSNKIVKQAVPLKISSAMLMGMAICGMHYTGMEAAVFTHIPEQAVASVAPLLHPESLSWAIAGVTTLILLIALGVSKYSIYLVQRRNKDLLETEAILEALNRSLTKAVDDLSVKEERIRAILAAAADGILVMDAIGVIESANHAAEAMFHYSAEEMISSQITDFLGLPDPINPDLLQPIAFEEMLQKSDAVVEYVGVSKNAETFPIELSISSSKVGDKTFYIIVCRDIQERKRAEKKVQSLNQQLVHTARLAGMAEVATSVLHNVGNVLNSINVSAKILLGRDMSNKIRGFRALADTLLQNRAALSTFVQHNPVGRALPEYVSQFADFLEEDW
jgi:PAS domain S-box-containing protein